MTTTTPTGQTHPQLARRIESLRLALEVGADRLPAERVRAVSERLVRVDDRLSVGDDHTVVALVGATGSGKSSLFNALARMDVAVVGVRRPMTTSPVACVWGSDGAQRLLEWLGVPAGHRTERESVLDADRESRLHGLVLLDLPDHDSTEVGHRLEVDRLVDVVDLLVWVVDPQKYADEALHSRYLRRLVGHEASMLVVLNQVDRLDPDSVATCLRDLRRLLDADGLHEVTVLATSARRGDGVEELRGMLADVVSHRVGLTSRAIAELDDAAALLEPGVGSAEPDPDDLPGEVELVDALASAAGVPVLQDAVESDYRRQAHERVGWPLLRWAGALRRDPLRRMSLGGVEAELRSLARARLAEPAPAQRSRVELAVHAVAAAAAEPLPALWGQAVLRAARPPDESLTDALDHAIGGVDLRLRTPGWWGLLHLLQVAFALTGLAGAAWLVLLGGYRLRGSAGEVARSWQVAGLHLPVPLALLVAGLLGGLVLSVVAGWAVRRGARQRAARVGRLLRNAIATVARQRVVEPMAEVLREHRTVRQAVHDR